MKHARTHRTLSGINIAAPGGLDALFAHHRALFGDATMSANAGDAGAGGAGGSAAGGEQGGAGSGEAAGQTGEQGAGGKAPAGTDWDGKVESLPEGAQKMIRELRAENGDRRTKLTAAETQQQEIVRAFAKAAGIDLPGDDDQQPDPAKLTEQLTATQAQARRASVELAVYRAAGTHQGDPNALLDSNAFLAKVTDLDPAAADFQSKVDDAIKTAVAANPKLKAQAAGKSSVDHSAGGSGEGRNRTPRPLTDAVAGHYGTA